MQGAITTTASDHVVLLGYDAGRTERIAGQLLAERRRPNWCCARGTRWAYIRCPTSTSTSSGVT